MAKIKSLKVRATPRVTFSALVDVMTSPSHRLPAILTPQKRPKPGPVFGYKLATEQLVAHIVHGKALNLKDPLLRDHELELLQDVASDPAAPASLMPAGARSCSMPSGTHPKLSISGVEITFTPDFFVGGKSGSRKTTGAAKLYMRKDPVPNGAVLASLMYFYRSQVVGDVNTDPNLCAIVDVQAGDIYVASKNYQRLLNQVNNACSVIAAVWPTL